MPLTGDKAAAFQQQEHRPHCVGVRSDTPDQFLTTARTKLAEIGVTGEPQLPIHMTGDRAGEPKRRVVHVKGVAIVGYALLVTELSAADSLTLQEAGLGGRTHLGCGFFTPAKPEGK